MARLGSFARSTNVVPARKHRDPSLHSGRQTALRYTNRENGLAQLALVICRVAQSRLLRGVINRPTKR
jgi:hypothetical protein